MVRELWHHHQLRGARFAALGLSLLLLTVTTPAYAGTKGGEDAIVKQFYPQKWESTDRSIGPYSYADADLDGPGKGTYIVAAYTNGFSGLVRVIKMQGKIPHLVATTSYPYMGGVYPTVTLVDVDGDGRPEVDVGFTAADGRNNSDWILKWNGSALQSIGPVTTDSRGHISSELYSPAFLDLTGNGKLDIISAPEDVGAGVAPSTISPVYSLVDGKYQKSGSIDYINFYRRKKGAPTAEVDTFPAPSPSDSYVMTVVNGSGTSNLVSSAVIKLNGATVVNQSQFDQQTKLIKVPVTLQASNTLSVTVNGAPGALLTVAVGSPIQPQ